MARKTIHYMDLESLLAVNKEVVMLTNEPHGFTPADGEKLQELLAEVEGRGNNEKLGAAVSEKAALLVFRIASGQHFRGGNKRTALVAGVVFLRKNGRKMDITDPAFVSTVDKVGIAAATLDDLYAVMEGLVTRSPLERRSWGSTIKQTVAANKKFLIETGS